MAAAILSLRHLTLGCSFVQDLLEQLSEVLHSFLASQLQRLIRLFDRLIPNRNVSQVQQISSAKLLSPVQPFVSAYA